VDPRGTPVLDWLSVMGLSADFYPLPGGSTWLALRARLGGVAPNLGTRQGVDFGGQVGFLTMGIGVFLQGYERVEGFRSRQAVRAVS